MGSVSNLLFCDGIHTAKDVLLCLMNQIKLCVCVYIYVLDYFAIFHPYTRVYERYLDETERSGNLRFCEKGQAGFSDREAIIFPRPNKNPKQPLAVLWWYGGKKTFKKFILTPVTSGLAAVPVSLLMILRTDVCVCVCVCVWGVCDNLVVG